MDLNSLKYYTRTSLISKEIGFLTERDTLLKRGLDRTQQPPPTMLRSLIVLP